MKNLFLFIAFLVSSFAFSQFGTPQVTYDPTNASNMTQQITTSSKQLVEMQKTVEYLQKTQEQLSKVSNLVQQLSDAKQIVSNYNEALKYAKKMPSVLAKMKNKTTATEISNGVVQLITDINNSMIFSQRLLTSGGFQMSDYERITLLKEELTKSNLMKRKMKKLAE